MKFNKKNKHSSVNLNSIDMVFFINNEKLSQADNFFMLFSLSHSISHRPTENHNFFRSLEWFSHFFLLWPWSWNFFLLSVFVCCFLFQALRRPEFVSFSRARGNQFAVNSSFSWITKLLKKRVLMRIIERFSCYLFICCLLCGEYKLTS